MPMSRISVEDQQVLYRCYDNLAKRYEVKYIAHYIDDLATAPAGATVHYSGLAADYYWIYDPCDVLVSPRLHGCGIAASLGIPSICLAHDKRGVAAELFGSLVVTSPENVDALIDQHDWKARSQNVLDIKHKVAALYQLAIRPMLDSVVKSRTSGQHGMVSVKQEDFAIRRQGWPEIGRVILKRQIKRALPKILHQRAAALWHLMKRGRR